jgi:hypothetical protein
MSLLYYCAEGKVIEAATLASVMTPAQFREASGVYQTTPAETVNPYEHPLCLVMTPRTTVECVEWWMQHARGIGCDHQLPSYKDVFYCACHRDNAALAKWAWARVTEGDRVTLAEENYCSFPNLLPQDDQLAMWATAYYDSAFSVLFYTYGGFFRDETGLDRMFQEVVECRVHDFYGNNDGAGATQEPPCLVRVLLDGPGSEQYRRVIESGAHSGLLTRLDLLRILVHVIRTCTASFEVAKWLYDLATGLNTPETIESANLYSEGLFTRDIRVAIMSPCCDLPTCQWAMSLPGVSGWERLSTRDFLETMDSAVRGPHAVAKLTWLRTMRGEKDFQPREWTLQGAAFRWGDLDVLKWVLHTASELPPHVPEPLLRGAVMSPEGVQCMVYFLEFMKARDPGYTLGEECMNIIRLHNASRLK